MKACFGQSSSSSSQSSKLLFWCVSQCLSTTPCHLQIVPSGGLLGFGVAKDLLTKDFDYSDKEKNPWDGSNRDD